MSTPPIQSTGLPTTSLPNFPTRLGAKLWESLTWALTSRHSTTFKIVGLVAVIGLLYCGWRLWSSMGSKTVSKPNPQPLPPPVELPQQNTAALPDGITQEQVDELVHVLTANYRKFVSGSLAVRPGVTLTKSPVYLVELEKICKGKTPGNDDELVRTFKRLCTYLQEQKIIVSCVDCRCFSYELTLHEEFIQKLRK